MIYFCNQIFFIYLSNIKEEIYWNFKDKTWLEWLENSNQKLAALYFVILQKLVFII